MVKLPQEPGFYFWYIIDWGYFKVGSIRVSKDPEKHINYLKSRPPENPCQFYLYQNDKGETLTMYHEAYTGNDLCDVPPTKKGSTEPIVDGYVPFDFDDFMSRTIK
jgi:hypothetical protein